MTAFAFAVVAVFFARKQAGPPPEFLASVLLFLGGHLLSAGFTAAGLVHVYRYGMKVWVGEGVNRARLLLLGTLLVGFTIGVLAPTGVWLAASAPRATDAGDVARVSLLVSTICILMPLGAIVLLAILDWVSPRVVADRPGKFGPKVPAVGKWN